MYLARNHCAKWIVIIFLPLAFLSLPHLSECAEWTVVTPPNVNQYWEVARVHFTSALEGWAVGGDYANLAGALLHYRRGLSPSEGTFGTEISIRGSGFGATKGTVLVGSTSLTIIDWTDGLIRCRLAKPIAPGVFDVTILPKEPNGASPNCREICFYSKAS